MKLTIYQTMKNLAKIVKFLSTVSKECKILLEM